MGNYLTHYSHHFIMPETVAKIDTPTSENVVETIKNLDETVPDRYEVEWASEKADPDRRYEVEEIAFCRGGRMKMRIVGPQGGNYEVDSKLGTLDPEIVLFRKDGYEETSKLKNLTIIDTEKETRGGLLEEVEFVDE